MCIFAVSFFFFFFFLAGGWMDYNFSMSISPSRLGTSYPDTGHSAILPLWLSGISHCSCTLSHTAKQNKFNIIQE